MLAVGSSSHASVMRHRRKGNTLGTSLADYPNLVVEFNFDLTQGGVMQFYNLKTKAKVDIPDSDIKKRRSVRTTSRATPQDPYPVVPDMHVDGNPIHTFH